MDVKTMILINYIEIAIHLFCLIFQAMVVIFLLINSFKTKSVFHSAYFAMLNTIYILDILFNIAWIYGHWLLYANTFFMPVVYVIQFHAQALLGIWEMFLGLNRCTALAFPVIHKKIWNKNLVILYMFILLVSPFVVHWYLIPNFYCKFFPTPTNRCPEIDAKINRITAITNIVFGLIAFMLIIVGVILSPKSVSSQTNSKQKMERRLIYQSIFSSTMLVLLYFCSYFHLFIQDVPYFLNISYLLYLLQFYPPMIILFFISPVVREEFAKFYRINFLLKNNSKIFSTKIQTFGITTRL